MRSLVSNRTTHHLEYISENGRYYEPRFLQLVKRELLRRKRLRK